MAGASRRLRALALLVVSAAALSARGTAQAQQQCPAGPSVSLPNGGGALSPTVRAARLRPSARSCATERGGVVRGGCRCAVRHG